MGLRFLVAVYLLCSLVPCIFASTTSDEGECPSPTAGSGPIPEHAIPHPPTTGVHYLGVVTMLVSLSDTGYVCDVRVLKGITQEIDNEAVKLIKGELFQPIEENGRPIPGTMIIERDYWRGDTSDFTFSQNADASPDQIPSKERTFHAADISNLIADGKVEKSTYTNRYFGLSFTAPGATFDVPSFVDSQGRGVGLVEATADTQKRENTYSILVLADRLSNYPDLKSRGEYLSGMTIQLTRTGAKTTRSDFPYVISDVDFVSTMLQEPDAPGLSHLRGLFCTVMKGYVILIDIAAPTEKQVLKTASAIEFKGK